MADSAPPLRPFSSTAVLLPTGAEAADFDRYAIDGTGVPHFTLMENAGKAVAAAEKCLSRPQFNLSGAKIDLPALIESFTNRALCCE